MSVAETASLLITDFQLDFFDKEPDTIPNFRIGNSRFWDDVWDFKGFHKEEGLHDAAYQIKYTCIKHPAIRLVYKQFMVLELMKSFPTAKRNFDALTGFYSYLEENFSHLTSLNNVSRMIVAGYFQSVLDHKSAKTGGPLSRTGIFKKTQSIKDLFLEGSKAGWDVPQESSYVQKLYSVMIEESPRTKTPTEKTTKTMFEIETVQKIIACALEDEDIITKASIIIQSQVGFRINELLDLKVGCVQKIDEDDWIIEMWTKKTKKKPVRRLKPCNELVVEVVMELERLTEPLRKESGLPYLFIYRSREHGEIGQRKEKSTPKGDGVIRVYNKANWNRDIEQPFVERWDIREKDELINLTSHYYRHIFATWAHRNGMNIQSILEMFDHTSLAMTEVYTHISEEEMKAKMAEVFSEDAIIAGVAVGRIKERLKNDNPFKGRTQKQIDLIMSAMRLKVMPNGVCFHHPARIDPCAGEGECVTCPNFVSAAMHLPVHELRVKGLEAELERAKADGNLVWYEKTKNLRNRIIEVFIEPLKAQLKASGGDS